MQLKLAFKALGPRISTITVCRILQYNQARTNVSLEIPILIPTQTYLLLFLYTVTVAVSSASIPISTLLTAALLTQRTLILTVKYITKQISNYSQFLNTDFCPTNATNSNQFSPYFLYIRNALFTSLIEIFYWIRVDTFKLNTLN